MAPLAENVTARMKIQYRAANATHWAMLRYPRGMSQSTMESDFIPTISNIFAAFALNGQLVDDFQWLQLQYMGEDQNSWEVSSSLPDPVVGTVDITTLSKGQLATHTKFSGRGGGRNCNLTLFGIMWAIESIAGPAGDGIVFSSESTEVSGAVSALNTSVGVTIANVPAVWKGQANIKINDYWRDEFKRA